MAASGNPHLWKAALPATVAATVMTTCVLIMWTVEHERIKKKKKKKKKRSPPLTYPQPVFPWPIRLICPLPSVAATVMTTCVLIMWKVERERTKKKKRTFPVTYPQPVFPWPMRLICRLPDLMRRPLILKGAAPQPPFDGVDLISEDYDPYEIKELEKNRLWRVRYRFAPNPALKGAAKSLFGIDLSDKESIVNNIPDDKVRKNVERFMDEEAKREAKLTGLDLQQQQRDAILSGLEDSQDMFVVRLSSRDGGGSDDDKEGLLLCNPCRMHEKILSFFKSLDRGKVRYIVSGSSSHTNQLPQAAAAFPSAKIICAEVADLKCSSVGMRRADFIYTKHDDDDDGDKTQRTRRRGYRAAVAELMPLGVQLFHVAGDVMTQACVVIAHGHLFETDLTYGNGNRWLHSDQEVWNNPPPSRVGAQIFYFAAIQQATIAGYLPDYRIMALDPSSPFAKLQLDEPDETSCAQMATSLRQLLRLKFDWVDTAHSKRRDSLPAAEYIQCVDKTWNWLDGGKSLLLEE